MTAVNPSTESLAVTVVRGSGLAGAGWTLAQVITLAVYMILARLVTPEEFGYYAVGFALVMLGWLVAESGMISALIQRDGRLEEAANSALVATLAGGVGLTLLMVGVSPLVGALFGNGEVTAIVAAMAGLLFVRAAMVVPDALLQRRFSYVRRTVIEPLSVLTFGAVAIGSVSAGLGVWGLVVGQYAGGLVELTAAWAFARWRPRLRLASMAMWRELIAYGRHVIVASVILAGGTHASRLVIGALLGPASLGQYSYGHRIASTPFVAVSAAASWLLFPAFARIKADPDRFRAGFSRSFRWTAVIAVPLGLMLLPLGASAAVVLFGETWRPAGEAAAALAVFAVASALGSVALEAVKASGQSRLLVRAEALIAALTLTAIAALAPAGLTEVSAGISVAAAIGLIYSLILAGRVTGASAAQAGRELIAPAVAAGLMCAAQFGLNEALVPDAYGLVRGSGLLLTEAVAGIAVYLVALELLRPRAARELLGLFRAGLGRRAPQALTDHV